VNRLSVKIDEFDLTHFVEIIKDAFTIPSDDSECAGEITPYDEIVYGFSYGEFPRHWSEKAHPDIVKCILEDGLLVFLPFEISCFEDSLVFCVDGGTLDIPLSESEEQENEVIIEIAQDDSNVLGYCVIRQEGDLLIESCMHHKASGNNLVPFLRPLKSCGFLEERMTIFLEKFIEEPGH
jgi:hypothetical protein